MRAAAKQVSKPRREKESYRSRLRDLGSRLSDREQYALTVAERRAIWAVILFVCGIVLVGSAAAIGLTHHPRTCVERTVTKTTTSAVKARPASPVEKTTTNECSETEWPKVPLALGALGALFLAPVVLRLLPPGAKFGLGTLKLDAGQGTPFEAAEKSVAAEGSKLDAMTRQRHEEKIGAGDAPA